MRNRRMGLFHVVNPGGSVGVANLGHGALDARIVAGEERRHVREVLDKAPTQCLGRTGLVQLG